MSKLFDNEAVCICGHSSLAHRYNWKTGMVEECSAQNVSVMKNLMSYEITPCDCKQFIHMDWITDFCIFPEKILTNRTKGSK